MGCKDAISADTPSFLFQGPVAENTRRSLRTGPGITGKSGDSSPGNNHNIAGDFKLFAEFNHSPGVSLAFIGRPDTVFNMDAVKGKTGFFAQNREAGQHGGRIGAAGNSGKENLFRCRAKPGAKAGLKAGYHREYHPKQ